MSTVVETSQTLFLDASTSLSMTFERWGSIYIITFIFYLVNPGGFVAPPCPPKPGGRLLPPPLNPGGLLFSSPNPGVLSDGGLVGLSNPGGLFIGGRIGGRGTWR